MPEATIVLNDHTAVQADLEAAANRKTRLITPRGILERRHPILQIIPAVDPTKTRKRLHSASAIAAVLRGILHDLGEVRVGLLTHMQYLHKGLPQNLGDPYAARITKSSYFYSGQSRGSNEWTQECDVLVVFGTPRIPSMAIRKYLFQVGKSQAALRTDVKWGLVEWIGKTQSSEEQSVHTLRYSDPEWHAAYCALTIAEIKQSIGRGRDILPDGIPVYIVTTEELEGIPIADHSFAPLTRRQAEVLSTRRYLGQRQESFGDWRRHESS